MKKGFVFALGGLAELATVLGQNLLSPMSTVVECFPLPADVTASLIAWVPPPVQTLPVQVPGCEDCDCSSCVHVLTYTTTYPALGPTGVADVTWEVHETHSGMSTVTRVTAHATGPAPGFTAGAEVCTNCGPEPLTTTLTYPIGGAPYVPIETLVPGSGGDGDAPVAGGPGDDDDAPGAGGPGGDGDAPGAGGPGDDDDAPGAGGPGDDDESDFPHVETAGSSSVRPLFEALLLLLPAVMAI